MTKRLQVLLDEAELLEIQDAAKRRRMTVAEWVRTTLRAARAAEAPDPRRKLAAVRTAMSHAFPSGDIDEILAEIEDGYRGKSRS